MAKTTCQNCKRTVLMVDVGGELVATDPEVKQVITATHRPGNEGGSIRMANRITPARELHASRCEDYQNQERKQRLVEEMREFTRKQQRSPKRNHGL